MRIGKKKKDRQEDQEEIVRVRMPEEGEVLGILEQKMGHGKYRIVCSDKKIRLCRVPGSKRRGLWLKVGDVVLVKPWDVQSDERGDLIYKYTPPQVQRLKEMGMLKDLVLE